MSKRLSTLQQKIIVVLVGGIAMGMSGSPRTYFEILAEVRRIYKEVDRSNVRRSLRSLAELGVVRENRSGAYVLTARGRARASTAVLDELTLPRPSRWDHKWRLIMSDIPESHKRMRDSLRYHLERLGCKKLQKSVWVYPHECFEELQWLVRCHKAQKYVRFAVAESLDNEEQLKKHFDL